MTKITLTDMQRAELFRVLRKHADRVERVSVFGSRANGTARPGSDVDLVLYGTVDRQLLADIASDLDESYLSINADVIGYEVVSDPRFRARIDETAVVLFEQSELIDA